jgi:REP-associated tyrosine transposase
LKKRKLCATLLLRYPTTLPRSESELDCFAQTISVRRKIHGFLVTAWVLLPDHWHAILYPHHPLTISEAMESIKVSSTRRINRRRGELGPLWQGRFFDRAVRTAKEYHETVEYIHLNPVKAGLVRRPEDWPWSSVH